LCGQGSRVAGLGFEGGFPAVERAARDTEGVTGCGQAVLVEETKHFKASVDIFGYHASKDAPEPLPGKTPGCDTHRGRFAWHSSWFMGVPKVSELMQAGVKPCQGKIEMFGVWAFCGQGLTGWLSADGDGVG
jgi:hypothetical protein